MQIFAPGSVMINSFFPVHYKHPSMTLASLWKYYHATRPAGYDQSDYQMTVAYDIKISLSASVSMRSEMLQTQSSMSL